MKKALMAQAANVMRENGKGGGKIRTALRAILEGGGEMKIAWMVMAMVAILMIASGSARAATITPTGASDSSFLNPAYDAGNIIDNSGLSGLPYNESSTHSSAAQADIYWSSDNVAPPHSVYLDLGANYDLSDAFIWNWNYTGLETWAVSNANFYVNSSVAGGTWIQVGGTQTLSQGGTTAQTVGLSASGVRRVWIEALNAYGSAAEIGLSEVKFNGALSASQDTRTIVTPTAATASGDNGNTPDQTIDGSGLVGTDIADARVFQSIGWISQAPTRDGPGGTITDVYITFDLGSVTNISGALIWNYYYPGYYDYGVSNLDVYASTTGTGGPWTKVNASPLYVDMVTAAGNATYHDLGSFSADAIKFQILNNHIDTGAVALEEVRFVTAAAAAGAPEPTLTIADNNVDENLDAGAAAGSLTVNNTNGTFTFSLVETGFFPDNTSFTLGGVNSSNVLTAAVFDYEAQTNYNIRVLAAETGGGGLQLTNTFAIAVNDINETFGGVYALAEVTAGQTAVATLQSLPGQNTSVAYSKVTGFDSADFSIAGDALSLNSAGVLGDVKYIEIQAVGSPLGETNSVLVKVSVVASASTTVIKFE